MDMIRYLFVDEEVGEAVWGAAKSYPFSMLPKDRWLRMANYLGSQERDSPAGPGTSSTRRPRGSLRDLLYDVRELGLGDEYFLSEVLRSFVSEGPEDMTAHSYNGLRKLREEAADLWDELPNRFKDSYLSAVYQTSLD